MDKLILKLLVLLAISYRSVSEASVLTENEKHDLMTEMEARILHLPKEEYIQIDGVRYIRQSLNDKAKVKGRVYPALNPIPVMQVFSGRKMSIKKLVTLLGSAGGYHDVFIAENADVDFQISINEMENDLRTIAQYISDKSPVEVSIYPETHILQVWPSRKPKYPSIYE